MGRRTFSGMEVVKVLVNVGASSGDGRLGTTRNCTTNTRRTKATDAESQFRYTTNFGREHYVASPTVSGPTTSTRSVSGSIATPNQDG